MRIDWIAEVARATGYPVVEVDGWETRGVSDGYNPSVVVAHHTAGPATGDMPSLGLITNGRSDLPGPLANYGLGRSGTIYVVASGKANNAGEGGWTVGGVRYDSNYDTVGIEAENTGYTSDPWPDAQLDSYARLCAAICEVLGRSEAYLCGHKEWAPTRKVDPHSIPMNTAREVVGNVIEGEDMPTEDEIRAIVRSELDRPIEGAWQEQGSFWGIQQAVLIAPIGNSGLTLAQHLANIYKFTDSLESSMSKVLGYTDTLEASVTRLEAKIDELEAGSGTTPAEVDEKITTHASNPDAHHA